MSNKQIRFGIIKKFQIAIQQAGELVTVEQQKFYSREQSRWVTMYHIKRCVDINGERYRYEDLYKTSSEVRVVLFLRDYYFTLLGKELPTDNEQWNKVRENLYKGGD